MLFDWNMVSKIVFLKGFTPRFFLSICCVFCWASLAIGVEQPLSKDTVADMIVVDKSSRELTLYASGKPLKVYRVALGKEPVGPKEKEGDKKTPEGTYIIDYRQRNSRYHLALHISYPNEKDRERAREKGVSPGGSIMIHGIRDKWEWFGELHQVVDWTAGCIAVTNEEIEELWRLVPVGTPIEIKP